MDGSQKDRLTKPFDSTKKPWKKPGSGNSDQISHPTEEKAKLKKRLKQKSKKHKKRACDSWDNDQPSGIHLDSTDTRPIKATKLALDTIRANEIAIENPETGKVTAVVTMLKVFGDKIKNSRNANPKSC
jgi:hypothetical protein